MTEIDRQCKFKIDEAVRNVKNLMEIPLTESVSNIQASNLSILYKVDTDTNFEDISAFRAAFATSAEDAKIYAQLNKILEVGEDFAIMLYSWRSISRALPFIRSADQPNRIEIYEKTIEILEPYAQRLKNFMYFQADAIERFICEMKRLAHKDKNSCYVNQAYLLVLGKMLKMFALLDEIKNMKASMKNDFSAYKRATQLRQHHDPQSTKEAQQVSVFLAQQRIIRDTLKDKLVAISGYEDLLADIINNNIQMFEEKTYVLPEEKHTLVMVIAFSIYLLDSSKVVDGKTTGITLNKMAKKINYCKIDKIFKECEVVNLFGDMSLEPFNYVKQTASYDPTKWPELNGTRISSQGNIMLHLNRFRTEYTSLTADLAWHTNSAVVRLSERSSNENKEIYELALRALQYLSGWSVQVLDTFTWKLLHAADDRSNPDCPKDAESYEKATRYNYSSEERFALIEIITMIKSIQSQLLTLEANYSEAIRRTVYRELQTLVLGRLSGPLAKAQKKKDRANVMRLITAIQATCADSITGLSDVENIMTNSGSNSGNSKTTTWGRTMSKIGSSSGSGSLSSGSASSAAQMFNRIDSVNGGLLVAKRQVAPSSSQIYLVRIMLELLCDLPSTQTKKDIDSATMQAIEGFLKQSFYWPYLLNFTKTLMKCCDLSQLWYREFFLEITNGARIQFPIEMSIPWILIDHILKTQNPGFMEYVLYPLDLYNDAAECALYRFKRRYLYDEIEAEANLVFDQLVYKLSDQVYRHYKQYAANILLEKRFRAEAQKAGWREAYPPPIRYSVALIKQQNVQLLGRPVDLRKLLAQRINKFTIKSIEVALKKFTSGDLTGVVELESLLDCSRLCHNMIGENLILDDFDALYEEANNQVGDNIGQITVHTFWELTYDLVKNYCYTDSTGRFVPTKFTLSEVLERSKPEVVEPQFLWGSRSINTCYEAIMKLYHGFIGTPHFVAICRLLGYHGIHILIAEMMKILKSHIEQVLTECVGHLSKLMPKTLNPPAKLQKSPEALFNFYVNSLRQIYQYPELKTDVCQSFRELGNMLIFVIHIERCLTMSDFYDLLQASPFIGQFPRPFMPQMPATTPNMNPNDAMQTKLAMDIKRERDFIAKEFAKKQEMLSIVNLANKIATHEHVSIAKENEVLTRERLCWGLVISEYVLNKLGEYLHQGGSNCADNGNEDCNTNASMVEDSHSLSISSTSQSIRPVSSLWTNFRPETINRKDLFDVDGCGQFHRIWSAIQFVFCTPCGQNEFTVEEMFGEGLNWAGCAIILSLGQQRRFEALDIGGILMRAHKMDRPRATLNAVGSNVTSNILTSGHVNNETSSVNNSNQLISSNLDRIVGRLNRFTVLNRQIFATLNNFLNPKARQTQGHEKLRQYSPPTWTPPPSQHHQPSN